MGAIKCIFLVDSRPDGPSGDVAAPGAASERPNSSAAPLALTDRRLDKSTIIVFLSDHGVHLGFDFGSRHAILPFAF